jgi:glycosyltransferase involved in cell wall biosynthesis
MMMINNHGKDHYRIAFINRRPVEGQYSIESYFKRISDSLRNLGVDLQSFTSPYTSKGLVPRLKIIRFAHRHQEAINHITGDIHFAALGLDPARTVVTVHDCGRLHQLSGIKQVLLRQIWFEIPLRRAAAITVISQAVKDDLLNWVPTLSSKDIHIIPVSISPLFTYSARVFNDSNPRILQIGTKANKNLPRLAQAMRGLDATLVIIGKLDKDLLRLLSAYNIRYENYSGLSEAEVVDLYRSSDILAFASTLEGFGMPILEAQAIGRVVLTSNCTSMPDVAGGGALLVDPYSVSSIRAGLIRLIEDSSLRQQLISRGLRNTKRFSSDAIAAQYLQVYQSILPAIGYSLESSH